MINKFFRILFRLLSVVLALLFLFLLVIFAKPLWHRLVSYPRMQKEVEAFSQKRKECPPVSDLKIYRGVLHLHSWWSHDSKGTIQELTAAAKLRNINFIFLTDHPHGIQDTFPRGYKGMYDGILVEPGSEKQGFDAWPLDTCVIDWKGSRDTVAKEIVKKGGIVFYAHTEEPHNWANEWFQGMEIYNFHSNILQKKSTFPILTDFLINGPKYRAWAYHTVFDRQTSILARWDSLNTRRKVVGFSAVDEHENVNIRARYLKDGRVQWVGMNAKPMDTVRVSFWNRWLFHEPDPSGWIFRWMIVNTYETSFNNSVNYLFADSLTVPAVKNHLLAGHHFAAFRFLGDATGFCFYGKDQAGRTAGIMGDSIKIGNLAGLAAVSPFPGRFTLLKDGKTVDVSASGEYGYTYSKPLEKGAYRLEVEVMPGKEWLPWIYTNPIYLY